MVEKESTESTAVVSPQRKAAQLEAFKASWRFTRALSLDLLAVITNENLHWAPADSLGSFRKQFRHLGRVQENYLNAIDTGVVKFTPEAASYSGTASRDALEEREKLKHYLANLDARLFETLSRPNLPDAINWFGEPVDLAQHLFRLDSHEVLHHGQLVVYCKLSGQAFPQSWKIWGL